MGYREDLSYEKSETKVPYIFTEAKDMDEALDLAVRAIRDAQSLWDYAKTTGNWPATAPEGPAEPAEPPSRLAKTGLFAAGAATGACGTLLILLSLGAV